MQVVKENLSPCQVSLEIEVESEKVAKAVDQAYREFSRHITVPGFRKGKAPINFVKARVPDEQLRERTVEILVEPAYVEAIEQEEVKPFGSPKLELVALETDATNQKFSFKAVVPLPPQVELGQYTGLDAERIRYEITDDSVQERIDQALSDSAEYITTDRPAQTGDVVVLDLTITPEGASEPGPLRSTAIEIGEKNNLPGLDENLVGLAAGDDKAFQMTYPDDFPDKEAAGKTAGFYLTVKEIQEKKLPVLDDEFARDQGSDTVDELREKIRSRLETSMTEMSGNLLDTQLLDKIVASSTIEYPPIMVDSEVEGDVKELLDRLKRSEISLEDFLEQTGKTQDQLIGEMQGKAELRIRRGLVIGKLAAVESLEVTPEDVDAEIAERAAKQGATPEIMRGYLESTGQLDRISQTLIAKKVLGFVAGSAIIKDRTLKPDEPLTTEPAAAPEAAPEPKKAKPKTRKPKAEAEAAAE